VPSEWLSAIMRDERAKFSPAVPALVVVVLAVAVAINFVLDVDTQSVSPKPTSTTALGALMDYLGFAVQDLLVMMPVAYGVGWVFHIPRSGVTGSLFWPFFYVRAP